MRKLLIGHECKFILTSCPSDTNIRNFLSRRALDVDSMSAAAAAVAERERGILHGCVTDKIVLFGPTSTRLPHAHVAHVLQHL